MHLTKFSIRGFRSLADVDDIPISNPTVLAGCNDSGKTAVFAALRFLADAYDLVDEDRSYSGITEESSDGSSFSRCAVTEVIGNFELDYWEQEQFSLPVTVRIRREAAQDDSPSWEIWADVPDDGRLRDLSPYRVAELKEIASELGIAKGLTKKAEFEAALRAYASSHATSQDWIPLPSTLAKRLPAILPFDGKTATADEAIKSALGARVKEYMGDPGMQGKLHEIEQEIQDNLRTEARSLCDHIRRRCPDLAAVTVEPDISFVSGFRGAPLRIARKSGELVSLDRSGLGSSRRISLAVWEWMSELLNHKDEQQQELAASADELTDDQVPPPVQKIVIYDEPDTHLDYAQQRKIMRLIGEQSAIDHVHVMVATHSMNLIDGVDISDIVHLKLESDRTVVERLIDDSHDMIDSHLGKISASLGIRNSVLLHERYFLAVEGESEQRAFPLLFRLSEGMSLQAAGVALWACGNNEEALKFAKYLFMHGRTVVLAVDADSVNLPKGIFKPDSLKKIIGSDATSIVSMIGQQEGFNEFEEIFPDELWSRVANAIWPRQELWKPEDFGELRGQKKFSQEVADMLKEQSESGPTGKPEMMFQLAAQLSDPADVPNELREVFSKLRRLAN